VIEASEVVEGTVRAVSAENAEDIGRCVACYGLLFPGERVKMTGRHHTVKMSVWLDNDRQLIVHQQFPRLRHLNCNDTLGPAKKPECCTPDNPCEPNYALPLACGGRHYGLPCGPTCRPS
jgi:hypothetical protein